MKKLPYSFPVSARVTLDAYDALRTRGERESKSLNQVVRDAVNAYLNIPDNQSNPPRRAN